MPTYLADDGRQFTSLSPRRKSAQLPQRSCSDPENIANSLPHPFTSTAEGDPFTGEDKTLFMWFMGLFGLQMLVAASTTANLSYDVQSNTQEVQCVSCLVYGLSWLGFAVIVSRAQAARCLLNLLVI